MFGKKKVVAAPVVEGAAAGAKTDGEKPQAVQGAVKAEKLPGPRQLPGLVEKYVTTEFKLDAGIARILKIVIRRRQNAEKAFDCRIYDPEEAEASELSVKDYASLDGHQELVLYDGWYDENSKHVELMEKKKGMYDAPLFTEAEILQKIEALKDPGSSVYFYQNAGPAAGGPLGRGAAIIELNPLYEQKKGKKYVIYTANVAGMEPRPQRNRLFDSDKPKEVAKWVAQSHKKRLY